MEGTEDEEEENLDGNLSDFESLGVLEGMRGIIIKYSRITLNFD